MNRTTLYTEYGTTTSGGRRVFMRANELLTPIITEFCEQYYPQEVNLILTSLIALKTSAYAADLFYAANGGNRIREVQGPRKKVTV